MMVTAKSGYLSLIGDKSRDKAIEAILEAFRNEDKRETFYEFFEELSMIYEILSPDAFLRRHINDYETLTRMYNILKEAYDSGITTDRDFTRKTAQLVRETPSVDSFFQALKSMK